MPCSPSRRTLRSISRAIGEPSTRSCWSRLVIAKGATSGVKSSTPTASQARAPTLPIATRPLRTSWTILLYVLDDPALVVRVARVASLALTDLELAAGELRHAPHEDVDVAPAPRVGGRGGGAAPPPPKEAGGGPPRRYRRSRAPGG